MAIKTIHEWKAGSLSDYLRIGDEVDEDFVEYFVGVKPPAYMNGVILQMGEPCSHDSAGNALFYTLHYESGVWKYAGKCRIGKIA